MVKKKKRDPKKKKRKIKNIYLGYLQEHIQDKDMGHTYDRKRKEENDRKSDKKEYF